MKRLIISEFKKIFKNKINNILIFILSLLTIGITIFTYNNYAKVYDENAYYADFKGNKLNNGIEKARFVDKQLHQYKGEWNQQKIEQIKSDYYKLILKYPRKSLDQEKMIAVWGEHYQELLDLMNKNALTERKLEEYCTKYNKNMSFKSSIGNDYITIETYYKEDPIIRTIGLIYYHAYMDIDAYKEVDLKNWDEINNNLINIKDTIGYEYFFGKQYSQQEQNILLEYYYNHSQNLPIYFDSTISNNLMFDSLENVLLLPLFLVVIILANVFGIERQTKMESILYPTKTTKQKLIIAKLITGIIAGLFIVFSQVILCIIVSYMLVPIHTLDIVVLPMANTSIGEYVPYTYLTMLIQGLLFIAISTLSISIITLLLSYVLPNRFAVVIIMIVFLTASFFLGQLEIIPTIIKLFLPYNMSSFLKCFYGYIVAGQYDYPYIFINSTLIPLKWIMFIIWIFLSSLTSYLMIKHSKNNLTYY